MGGKFGGPPCKIRAHKHENLVLVFGQLPDFIANNFRMGQVIVNQKSALKTTDTARWQCNLVYFDPWTKGLKFQPTLGGHQVAM